MEDNDFSGTVDDWVGEHQRRLQEAHQAALQQMEQAAEARKRYRGPATSHCALEVGQLVYRRNHSFKGRHKIQDQWMAVPFRVVGHPDANKPVYTVVPVDASQAPKNIHRMELRPCGPGESASLGLEELAEPVTEEHSEGEAVVVMQRPPRTLPASAQDRKSVV